MVGKGWKLTSGSAGGTTVSARKEKLSTCTQTEKLVSFGFTFLRKVIPLPGWCGNHRFVRFSGAIVEVCQQEKHYTEPSTSIRA